MAATVLTGCELADRSSFTAPTEPQQILDGLLSGDRTGSYTLSSTWRTCTTR